MSYCCSMDKIITSTQAAKLLGVTRRTMLRWEERKWLRSLPQRDEHGNRIYREDHVRLAKHVWNQWINLRRYHREHLRKLPAIQREVECFIITTPLGDMGEGRMFDLREMQSAFRKMKEWQDKSRRIHDMYDQFFRSEAVEHVKLLAKGIEAGRIS